MKLLHNIPHTFFYVACSGGSDSMVLVDFLLNNPKNNFGLAFFNHETPYCNEAFNFVKNFATEYNLKFVYSSISKPKNKNESTEEFWRNERYKFLESLNVPVLTAHQLDDVVETWIFSSINGQSKLIPYRRNNIIRPLLLVSKTEINNWINKHHIAYISDPTNSDISFNRNFIRNIMMPNILKVNPGIHKTIRRKLLQENLNNEQFP
jgi:tRNA(Ile)-lysidine synthase